MRFQFAGLGFVFLIAGCVATTPATPTPSLSTSGTPTVDNPAATIERALLQMGRVRTDGECKKVFESQSYCSLLVSVSPLVKQEWQNLFPKTDFFLVKEVGLSREIIPDGGHIHPAHRIIALQKDRMYNADQFPDLLDVTNVRVTEDNREQVAQAFILFALPYYIENEIRFSDAQAIDIRFHFVQYNYQVTAWTRLHGLRMEYRFRYEAGKLRNVWGRMTGLNIGEGYIPYEPPYGYEGYGRRLDFNLLKLEYWF